MKRIAIALLMLLLATAAAHAVDYPAQAGSVYDGAGMIPDKTETALEQKLLDFETATTIGIAVCTVQSLQGVDSDTYAKNLGNHWAIGSPQTDNGVIILVAKQERKLALWFGDGYDTRWAQRTSQQVRENVMVPQLKAGRYDLAVEDGVNAVIAAVTSAGYVNKWSAGKAAGSINKSADADTSDNSGLTPAQSEALKTHQRENPLSDVEQDKAARESQQRTLFGGSALAAFVLLVVGILRARGIHARRRKLRDEIDSLSESLTHKLEQLPEMEAKLRAGYPEPMWGPALAAIDSNAMERAMYSGDKGRDNADLEQQLARLRAANGAVERVGQVLRRAEHGRSDGPRQLRELAAQLSALRTWMDNPDVLPETRAALEPLTVRQAELQAMLPADAGVATFDWASLADGVDKLAADSEALRKQAECDVAQVREARAKMPQMYEQAQQRLAELRARNAGRYGDVDRSLDEVESILTGQPGWANYGGASYDYSQLSSRDLMYMWGALQNALQHAQVAEVSYTSHTAPSSGSSFGGGGGSSSWGGGGGSSFGGGGGGGGSSSW